MESYKFYDMDIHWLEGSDLLVDGGRTFGPVPKALWNRHYPSNEENLVPSVTAPILIQYDKRNILIDTGHGTSKMSDKEKRNEGVQTNNQLIESLKKLDLNREDIDTILMTHMHNDHAGGLTYLAGEKVVSTFPNAAIYVQEDEWYDIQHPTGRTKSTYLKENWKPVAKQVLTFKENLKVGEDIRIFHSGGHTRGHSMVILEQEGETILHMADNFEVAAFNNQFWVSGVDDYPMDVIDIRQKWQVEGYEKGYYFAFYHDPYFALVQFDKEGKKIEKYLPREKKALIPFSDKQDRALEMKEKF